MFKKQKKPFKIPLQRSYINVGNDITETIGNNKSENIKANHSIQANKQEISLTDNLDLKVGTDADINVKNKISIESGNLKADVADSDLTIQVTGKIILESGDIIDIAQ